MSRVLVLRALGLGDLLTGVPALRAVRRAQPQATLLLAAPAGLRPLVELIGGVDAVLDTGPFTGRLPAGRLPAAARGAGLAVNLHGPGPQSTALLRTARPARLVAFGETAAWRPEEPEVRRWCRLVGAAGMPADPADLALARPPAGSPAPGAVLVHPGAAYPARRWPPDRWATVAAKLAAAGERVLLTGGPAEVELAGAVGRAAGLPPDAVRAGRTGLAELAALVAEAALLVCADTGVAHLATAYGTPSVVLFGPTSPRLWGPPPDRPQHRVLWAGQTGDPHADRPDPGLLEIGPADVLEAVAGLRAAAPAPG